MDLKQHIRSIPDFPKPGILFYDISTLLAHPAAWRATVARLAEALRPHQPALLVGIEFARVSGRRADRLRAGLRLCDDPQAGKAAGQDRALYL